MNDLNLNSLDNPFWKFSLQQWENNAFQTHLLKLQNEQNFRINLLLLAMWLSFEHKDIRPHLDELILSTSKWHEQIVAPLRKVRQALSLNLPQHSQALKAQVQTCELQAEQIEQALLYEACLDIPKNNTDNYDTLDYLILNLSASDLEQSDLLLLLQLCLPTYPITRIRERLQAHA